jgi:SAM-dependent methyltransferase
MADGDADAAGSDPARGWRDVWSRRQLDPSRGNLQAQLLAADGFDTGFGDIETESWQQFVRYWAAKLDAGAGTCVFEVGCGAGAFLYGMHRLGCQVGGIDQAPALVDIARNAIPGGRFEVADAADLPLAPADVVVSFSVFQYFPSLVYARTVLERMAVKARGAVAVFDLPDIASREEALTVRIASAGSPEAYRDRYQGLEHLHYGRDWVEDALRSCGLTHVRTADQNLPRYANGSFRFNAWGFTADGSR